jgi:hypothetical protein
MAGVTAGITPRLSGESLGFVHHYLIILALPEAP